MYLGAEAVQDLLKRLSEAGIRLRIAGEARASRRERLLF